MTQTQEPVAHNQNSFIVPGWVFVISGGICCLIQFGSLPMGISRHGAPPSLLALIMSFGAMMMGVFGLYRMRGEKGVWPARAGAIVIMIAGLFGPMMYSAQAVKWRAQAQKNEAGNISQIAGAARGFQKNQTAGKFPPSLAHMVGHGLITADLLKSPLGPISSSQKAMPVVNADNWQQLEKDVADAADYLYFGGDLPADAPAEIIVVTGKDVIWGSALNIGFADGSQKFVNQVDIENIRKASDEARARIGLPPLKK